MEIGEFDIQLGNTYSFLLSIASSMACLLVRTSYSQCTRPPSLQDHCTTVGCKFWEGIPFSSNSTVCVCRLPEVRIEYVWYYSKVEATDLLIFHKIVQHPKIVPFIISSPHGKEILGLNKTKRSRGIKESYLLQVINNLVFPVDNHCACKIQLLKSIVKSKPFLLCHK